MDFNPKISIITVVYNAHALIERTVRSVLSQDWNNIEYIIIDGGSSDGTLEIAEKYSSQIALIHSGKDNGIYDAMNKGLKDATGDYVLFLNAGDTFYSKDVIRRVFANGEADVYYGNTAIVDSQENIIGDRRLTPPEVLNWRSLRFGMCVSHQSFIARRKICEPYDLDYKVSSDIDWVIRVLKKSGRILNIQGYISCFLEGGVSNRRRKKALGERFRIMSRHYGFFRTLVNHIYILLRYPFHRFTRRSMT
ncbi:MAG: glycosyltransferase family 2 protein [Bacteroidia bacterium]